MPIKLIPYDTAINIALDEAGEELLPKNKNFFIKTLVDCCPIVTQPNGSKYLVFEDLRLFVSNVNKFLDQQDITMLMRKRGPKTSREVDVLEFVESYEFMGMKGHVYPLVADALWEIWHSKTEKYSEAVLSGATGIGKSFMVEMCIAYMLYKLSTYWDPQVEMDLAPGSPLYLVFQSRTERSATNILFRPFYARIKRTKYFTEVFPFRKDITSQLIFPNEIYVCPFSGSDDAVLGLTVVGGGITELNRMAYVEESKKRSRSVKQVGNEYDQAVAVYMTLSRRMTGRTMQLGKLWGLLVLDAAHEYGDDFTDLKIKESQVEKEGEKRIYVYQKMQWEVLPAGRFSGKKFLVEVGTERRRSRILLDRKQAVDDSRVKEIPIEYKPEFDKDVEGALKDFGGISVSSRQSAIPYREAIDKGFDDYERLAGKGKQLFKKPIICLDDYLGPISGHYEWEKLVDLEYVETMFMDRNTILAGHVDPALNHCRAGIAVGHIGGWKLLDEVSEYDPTTRSVRKKKNIRSPMDMIDGLLAIEAPEGDEIDLELLQSLGVFLYQYCGLKILSIDSFQSVQMRQHWAEVGLVTGHVSVDDTPEPYTRIRSAYREGRLITPRHPIYKEEIVDLQFDGAKFVKLPGKSKDVSDAAAGCVYLIETHLCEFTPDYGAMSISEKRMLSYGKAGRRLFPHRINY